MDQRGAVDLAQFLPPPSNSGPQEMESTSAVAGPLTGHLWAPPHSASLASLSVQASVPCSLASPPKGRWPCRCSRAITPKPQSDGFLPNRRKPWDKEENEAKGRGSWMMP